MTGQPIPIREYAVVLTNNFGEKNMKFLIVLALFLSQAAYADEFYTPTLIKSDANADMFDQNFQFARGVHYADGVVRSIKTIQNLGFVPKLICFPVGPNIKSAVNALDPAGFPNTDEGGTMYIYYALLAKYPC